MNARPAPVGVSKPVRLALRLLALAQGLRGAGPVGRIAAVPATKLYRLYSLHLIGMDVPAETRIGPGLVVFHGIGLVVHPATRIGEGVVLRQNTTIGAKEGGAAPSLGDGVDVGANSVVLGGISLGERCVVGAGSVVVHDVAPGDVVAGNPARPLSRRPVAHTSSGEGTARGTGRG